MPAPTATILINRLRYKHLALLVALADAHNLHQAADEINVAQPSASRMLADLEDTFGFMLFERLAKGMHPTPLGEIVIEHARQALAHLGNFAESLDVKRRGGVGQLAIGAIVGAAPDLLARAIAVLKQDRPLLNVRILGETSDQIVEMLERREIEIALGRFTSPLQHNVFDFEPLAREHLRLVVRTGHPLADITRMTLKDSEDWPWIVQPITSPARQLFENELAAQGLATPMNLVECGSIFTTLQLLQTSDAIAMLPESVVRDYLRTHLLVALPIEVGETLAGFGLLTRHGEPLSEAAERLIALLRHGSTPHPQAAETGFKPMRLRNVGS